MEKSLILELAFSGNCYADNVKISENAEYRKNNDEWYELCEELCKNMTEEETRQAMNRIFFAHCGVESVVAEEYFKEGFKFGLKMGAQNFSD